MTKDTRTDDKETDSDYDVTQNNDKEKQNTQ